MQFFIFHFYISYGKSTVLGVDCINVSPPAPFDSN